MQFMQPITIEDLQRVQRELIREIQEDGNDPNDRKTNGRWPMTQDLGHMIFFRRGCPFKR